MAILGLLVLQTSANALTRSDPLPLAAAISINKAQARADQGDRPGAVQTLKAYMKDGDKTYHPYLYFSLGNFLALGSRESKSPATAKEAIFWYQKALDTDPEFSQAWLNLAQCAYEIEDYKTAGLGFENGYASAVTPQALHLYYAAVCFVHSGDNAKALSRFESLILNHPDKITLNWKEVLVNILFSLEKYKRALPYIEELAQNIRPPRQKTWQEILLQQYLNLGMTQKALTLARTLTRTDPLEPKWWKALAHIHLGIDNNTSRQKALAALVIYGYLTPMTPGEKQLTGDLFLSQDIPEKAAEVYAQILDNKFDFKLLEKQARALVMAHAPEQALELINSALKDHAQDNKPGQNLSRLKKDLEQIITYRQSLKDYNNLVSQ